MRMQTVIQSVLDWLYPDGAQILLILAISLILLKTIGVTARAIFKRLEKEKDEESKKRMKTLRLLIQYIFSIGVVVVVAIIILGELGIKIGPILAAAGVLGLAVSFGAQHLVQDIISGFFILLEDQIRVGDVVQVAGRSGVVERVNLRMTVLRDMAGNVHYVRNGQIDVVTNMTKDFSRYVFEIGVAYREDIDEVIEVIRQVDEELRNDPQYEDDILEPIEILGLDQFAESALVIKARTKTKPVRQWYVGRAFNRLLKKRFDERGIEIPFPHITLYMGEDKEGKAPPLSLIVKEKSESDT